jgi:hypothetical protein
MQKILALLTLLVFVLPAIVVSLWWAALCSRLVQSTSGGLRGDNWETQFSARRAARLLALAALFGGCALIFWAWVQFANSQLDTFGLRPMVEWATTTLQEP